MSASDSSLPERATDRGNQAMTLLDAEMIEVLPGMTEIVLPFRQELTPPGVGVLTVEFKVNLLNEASGRRFLARGQVVKPGRTMMSAQAR